METSEEFRPGWPTSPKPPVATCRFSRPFRNPQRNRQHQRYCNPMPWKWKVSLRISAYQLMSSCLLFGKDLDSKFRIAFGRKSFYRDIFNVEEWTVQLKHGWGGAGHQVLLITSWWSSYVCTGHAKVADSKGVTSVESEALNTATRLKKAGKNGRLSINLVKMRTWFKQLLVQ